MSVNAEQDKKLQELKSRVQTALGADLEALVLYGSAANGSEFHGGFSDLNLLCLVKQSDGATLARLAPVNAWWRKQKQPAMLVFTAAELQRSADVFAIELLDMKSRHQMLYGEDLFTSFDVPTSQHRLQLERELRNTVIKLRQGYLANAGQNRDVLQMMAGSLATVGTLFRHALMALGDAPPKHKREAVEMVAAKFGLDAAAFAPLFDLREGKVKSKELEPRADALFAQLLAAVQRVTDEVDRLFAS